MSQALTQCTTPPPPTLKQLQGMYYDAIQEAKDALNKISAMGGHLGGLPGIPNPSTVSNTTCVYVPQLSSGSITSAPIVASNSTWVAINQSTINNIITTTKRQYNRVINKVYANSSSTNSVTYDENAISPTEGHTTEQLYELIANVLYSTQHMKIDDPQLAPLILATSMIAGKLQIKDGEACSLTLPDGAVLRVEKNGSYKIEDTDAKVIYRANRVRDFNTFINASDKLEDFIRYCGQQGVTQQEMLDLPVNLFIMWLIVEAARQDEIDEPEQPLLQGIRRQIQARCESCGRFMRKAMRLKNIHHCRRECYKVACAQC